ncbi:MAG: response regulator [Gemmatimonadetes bacterium]|nr:MAG: response regulator [Gemmatimonadota bacterium]
MAFEGKILVADDDPMVRSLAGKVLKQEGFDVVFAEDGQQAVEAARDPMIKLIVMDAMMPNLDGLRASEQIKGTINPDVLILLLTAVYRMTPLKYRKKGHEVVDSFMAKPFDLFSFLTEIKRMLNVS